MESKKKSFARKTVAFFLAVIMAVSCFSAAFSAFAANNNRDYHDGKLAANIMAWADATDEQTLEAVFDYLDTVLAGANINLDVEQNIVVKKISIHAKLRSIDDIIELIGNQLPKNVDSLKGLAGDLQMLNTTSIQGLQGEANSPTNGGTSACGTTYRSKNSAKVIIKTLCQFVVDNMPLINKVLDGTLSLGAANAFINVYEKLQPMLGTAAGYESDFFYNVTKAMMLSKTGWFTPEEVKAYESGSKAWNLDTVTREKLNELLVPQISAWVTYAIYNHDPEAKEKPHTESSAERLDKIQEYIKNNGGDYAAACTALGYDPNLRYCTISTLENNINIFEYGNDKLTINADTTLYSFASQAFKLAWKTVLKDTLQLVHVNHDNWKQDGSPTNFDNDFFYYMRDNNKWIPADSKTDGWKANYSKANIEAWAAARCGGYGMTQQEFLDAAKAEATSLKRTLISNPTYTWHDLEIMQFFNKLRYSPLADIYFDVQTGPLNLYLLQTGFTSTATFLDNWSKDLNNTSIDQPGILDEFNNGLVAMCEDLFMQGKNIGYANGDGTVTPIARPTFVKTTVNFARNSGDKNDAAKTELVNAITDNFFMLIEYLLNASDVNVLANLYNSTGKAFDGVNYQLTEANLEKSMLPLLIAAVNEVQFGGQRQMDQIHDETWDKCTSVEAVAICVLEEHLAWILPDKDYQVLYTFNEAGDMVATTDMSGDGKADETTLLEDVILIMTRDAVAYQLAPIMPLRHKVGENNFAAWSPYTTTDVTQDKTTLFDILNCVIVFYAGTNKWADDQTESQGMAGVLGVVEKNGNCKVNLQNDLWTNIDNIVNHLLPFFGVLQNGDMVKQADGSYKSSIPFSSHEFLMEVLVEGALNIADTKVANNRGGIIDKTAAKNYSGLKVFLYQLLTIISCDPIMDMDVEHVLYDVVLCPILNNVFGARYDTKYPHVIPTSEEMSAIYGTPNAGKTPIDSLFHKQVLVHYNGVKGQNGIGVLGILCDAIYKALGADNKADVDTKEGIEGAWNGAAFICQSVANLDPYFAPQLKAHEFGVLSAEVEKATQSGLAKNDSINKTNLLLKNTSNGLNRFYINEAGKVIQDPRFVMQYKDIKVFDNNTNQLSTKLTLGSKQGTVDPQQTVKIELTGKTDGQDIVVYRIETTYDVYEKGATTPIDKFTDQIAVAYFVVSTVQPWYNEIFDGNGSFWASNFTAGARDHGAITANYLVTGGAIKSNISATFPETVIVNKSNPNAVSNVKWRQENRTTWSTLNEIRGLYFKFTDANATAFKIPSAGNGVTTPKQYGAEVNVLQNYKGSGENVNELGMAAIDQTTGNILHHGYFDFYHPVEKRWYRGGADGKTVHDQGKNSSDNAFIGYTQAELDTWRTKKVTDPSKNDGSQIELSAIPGYKERTHVVWTYDEYMAGYDYNHQNSDETVKFVKRTAVGVDANQQPVYKYEYALIRINNAILYGNNGSCSMTTPIPGIYITQGYSNAVNTAGAQTRTWLAYDGVTDLQQTPVGGNKGTVVMSRDDCKAAMVELTFKLVDDLGLANIRDQYTKVSNEFAPYKSEDFNTVNGKNPYDELQKALGVALKESAKVVNTKSADSFISERKDVKVTSNTRSQIGDIALTRATTSDAITPEVAVKAYPSGGYYFADKACTIPVYTATPIVTENVNVNPAKETIDGQQLRTGITTFGDSVVEDANGKWHFRNDPKMETAWDTTTYLAPYLYETDTHEGLANKAPMYKQVVLKKYNNPDGAYTNTVPELKSIIKPNDGQENRNSMEQAADALTYWREMANANIAGGGAADIIKFVRDDFAKYDSLYINYDVHSFNLVKEVVAEAMALVKTTWVDDLSKPKMDPLNPEIQLTDKLTGKPLYEQKAEYTTSYSSLQCQMAIHEYQKAISRLIKKDYTPNKVLEEIAWSLGDPTLDNINNIGNVGFKKTTDPQTSATTYTEITTQTAYYGTVEGGKLVNKNADGNQAYTDESWANYINCLGKAIDVAQTYAAPENSRDEAFFARNDLMLAENELDPFEPVQPTDITVSGKVVIASDLTGTNYDDYGLANVNITVNGETMATTIDDGSFTAKLPAGTKEFVVSAAYDGNIIFNRTVTLAGDADIVNAIIPLVLGDVNADGFIDGTDYAGFSAVYEVPAKYTIYLDYNMDGFVDGTDYAGFSSLYDQMIEYAALTIK